MYVLSKISHNLIIAMFEGKRQIHHFIQTVFEVAVVNFNTMTFYDYYNSDIKML